MTDPSTGKQKLLLLALARLSGGLVIIAGLLFLIAGTFDYWQVWVFAAVAGVLMIANLVWLMRNDPSRLERRMRTREHEQRQKWLIGISTAVILLLFVLPGLDRRFGWSHMPAGWALLGEALAIAGYALYFRVIQENRYASRVIEVVAGQRVITSGPYARVRHPMYLGMTLFLIGTALALGSYWALIPAVCMIPVLGARAVAEEKTLLRELPGYAEYTRQVAWRLFPGIW